MLRHLSRQHSYWYCSSCRIEMPLIAQNKHNQLNNQPHGMATLHKSTINFPASSINAVIKHQENRKEIARLQ